MIKDIEFESIETIKIFQEKKLRTALEYLKEKSPYYQRMFDRYHIETKKIRHLEDLVKIPFTEKKDLQLFNNDFFCCPKYKIVDYITTSGTLGDPVTFACTDKDLDRLAYNESKSFACAGLHPGNILQLMTTIDKRFMAGLAYFLGIRKLGASIIRVGNGNPELQWDSIQRIHPDSIMCVPSFIPLLIQYAEKHNIDYRNTSVKKIIGIGEGLRNQDFSLNLLGKQIKSKWNVKLFSTYSSTEMGATFSECECGKGGHCHPELIIVEIIGQDGMPVADGETGEAVITTLGVEGMPLLRFRTGDICAKITEPCRCGRNSFRLTPIIGRKNNMIKLKGTTLYPPAINDVLDNTEYIENYCIFVENSINNTDDVTVKISLKSQPEGNLMNDLKNRFRAHLRVVPRIEILAAQELHNIVYPAKSRKPVKFIDLRKKP